MKKHYMYILFGIAGLITIYGLVTGKFFFLILLFPLGFGLFKKNKDHDAD